MALRPTRRARRLGALLASLALVATLAVAYVVGADARCHWLQAHHAAAYQQGRYC